MWMVKATEYAGSSVLSFVDSSAQIHGMRLNLIGLNNDFSHIKIIASRKFFTKH